MTLTQKLANAFSEVERTSRRVSKVHMSNEVLSELTLTRHCDIHTLWGAGIVVMPCGRDVTLVNSRGDKLTVSV